MHQETQSQSNVESLNDRAILERILASVQKDTGRGRLELATAIILSLTTLGTTWCGYQAQQWGGLQSTSQAAADTNDRKAAEDTIVGLQMRNFDLLEVKDYWAALRKNDKETGDIIFAHMRPQLRSACQAAIASGVLHDPSQPGPMQRPEYALKEEQDAKQLREESRKLNETAQAAGQACGSYVLLTLMFASVLFFGGITGTLTARRVRVGLAFVAVALFLTTLVQLMRLPVCPS